MFRAMIVFLTLTTEPWLEMPPPLPLPLTALAALPEIVLLVRFNVPLL